MPHAVTGSPAHVQVNTRLGHLLCAQSALAPRKILFIKKQDTKTLEVNERMALDGHEVTGQTHIRSCECCLSKAFSGRKGASLLPGSYQCPRRVLRISTETTVTDLRLILTVFLKAAS